MAKVKKSQRLVLVLDMAQRKEESARDALSKAKMYFDQQQGQLNMLSEYRGQYLSDLKASMSGPTTVSALQRSQGFIDQLNSAIEQQDLVVKHAQVQFDGARDQWLQCREKAKGLADLIDRLKLEEAAQAEKQEAKRLEDDLQGRRAFR